MSDKTIQIDLELFVDLIVYALRHSEEGDVQYRRIMKMAKAKVEAMMRHDLYSVYKTGATEADRAKARKKYLDAIGLFDTFRWDDRDVYNVTHHLK